MSFDIREHNLSLPKGWSYKKISDVAKVNANTIRKKDAPDEIYYIDISSVSNGSFEPPKYMPYADAPSRAKRIIKKNDFIISTVRPNLKQYVFMDEVDENWIASTGFAVVSAIEAGTEWYLYSVITSELFNEHLVRVADGGAYPAFNPKEIEDAVIFWPDDDSLRAINDLASNLNTKQKNNAQINQTLEQMAQAIFKSWFVDFDPVKAKTEALAAGKSQAEAELAAMAVISAKTPDKLNAWKTTNPQDYAKLAQTAALFPSEMVDSELGEVPLGWNYCSFGDVSACFDSKRVPLSKRKREEKQPGTIPYYGATSVMDYVNEWTFDDIYLLLGEDGSVVKDDGTPFVQYIWGKSWVNNHAHVLQGTNGISTEHLMVFMKRTNIASYVTGAVQLKLNQKNMNSIPFLKASPEINLIFQEMLTGLYDVYKNNTESSQYLSSLRDVLLPRLLSGEIELKIRSDNG